MSRTSKTRRDAKKRRIKPKEWKLYELDPMWFRARGYEPPKVWLDV